MLVVVTVVTVVVELEVGMVGTGAGSMEVANAVKVAVATEVRVAVYLEVAVGASMAAMGVVNKEVVRMVAAVAEEATGRADVVEEEGAEAPQSVPWVEMWAGVPMAVTWAGLVREEGMGRD